MTEQTKLSIENAITSILLLVFGFPTIAAMFPSGTLQTLQADIPKVFDAIGVLLTVGTFVWKLMPLSKSKKVVLAGELPEVSRVVTTNDIANSSVVKNMKDQRTGMPVVLDHFQAKLTPPPAPVS